MVEPFRRIIPGNLCHVYPQLPQTCRRTRRRKENNTDAWQDYRGAVLLFSMYDLFQLDMSIMSLSIEGKKSPNLSDSAIYLDSDHPLEDSIIILDWSVYLHKMLCFSIFGRLKLVSMLAERRIGVEEEWERMDIQGMSDLGLSDTDGTCL